jgi:hypothetical protein
VDAGALIHDEVRREVKRHDAVIGIGPVVVPQQEDAEQDGSKEEEKGEQEQGELDELSPGLGSHDPHLRAATTELDKAAASSAGEEKWNPVSVSTD